MDSPKVTIVPISFQKASAYVEQFHRHHGKPLRGVFSVGAAVEGGQWVNGRHNRPGGFAKDAEKSNTAALMGYFVYRFTGEMVESGVAVDMLERAFGRDA